MGCTKNRWWATQGPSAMVCQPLVFWTRVECGSEAIAFPYSMWIIISSIILRELCILSYCIRLLFQKIKPREITSGSTALWLLFSSLCYRGTQTHPVALKMYSRCPSAWKGYVASWGSFHPANDKRFTQLSYSVQKL